MDEVLEVSSKQKIANCGKVRVAYPSITTISFASSEEEHLKTPESAIPYTFEDALVLANIPIFRAMTDVTGLTRKMADSTKKSTLEDACDTMFDALNKSAKKAEMALDLLYSADPIELMPPHYIEEGLLWLKRTLEELSKSPLTQEV